MTIEKTQLSPTTQLLTYRRSDQLIMRLVDTPLHRAKAVSTPSAQSHELCDSRGTSMPQLLSSQSAGSGAFAIGNYEKSIIELMYCSGCRVSEVLRIKASDVSQSGLVKITASKGSANRFVHISYSLDFLLSLKAVNGYIFANYNRFYIYRLFKKLGFTQKFGDNVNSSVTHYFRKSAALEALSMNNDLQDIATLLGHKSAKSAHYYNKQ